MFKQKKDIIKNYFKKLRDLKNSYRVLRAKLYTLILLVLSISQYKGKHKRWIVELLI